ncbi:DUF4365 domain-containing protein [Nocardioides sp.]|uniref:DUF4365 domain-containing protein n=1 Tax=Nocardioides sp. TaxID=35761 RepID=UPI002C4A93EA|nr:DUF4365 domain-containing protein [Nocardioides sp.]HSX65920.1 DUF4365 domain-containing protein [Nocardioides sp.]
MEHTPAAKAGSIGVSRTALAVQDDLGWLFREQPTEDYGIDAHAEVVEAGKVTGRLLAMQIKGGSSWFKEPTAGGWWFRPEPKHVRYWTSHSLPVVVVLVHPKTKLCHWQIVANGTLQTSKGGTPKLLIPRANVLDKSAITELARASEGDAYELRLRELRLALPWMRRLADGQRLVIDVEEWINKTSGRGAITLGIDHEDGNDPEPIATWGVMFGLSDYGEVIQKLLAWADIDVHAETYEEAEYERWEGECVFYDEGDRFARETFEDWRAPLISQGLRPYANGAGEVDFWRLELTLSALGKAFLEVDTFATSGHAQLTE